MGNLDFFVSEVQGYYRHDDKASFPWASTGSSVWYTLITIENGKIQKYGFTSGKMQKFNLLQALSKADECDDVLLLGIWTEKYRTDLFVLDLEIAKAKLKEIN